MAHDERIQSDLLRLEDRVNEARRWAELIGELGAGASGETPQSVALAANLLQSRLRKIARRLNTLRRRLSAPSTPR